MSRGWESWVRFVVLAHVCGLGAAGASPVTPPDEKPDLNQNRGRRPLRAERYWAGVVTVMCTCFAKTRAESFSFERLLALGL